MCEKKEKTWWGQPPCSLIGRIAHYSIGLVKLQAEGVFTDVEASAALYRAVDSRIEGPAVSTVFAAVIRVSVVTSDFERRI